MRFVLHYRGQLKSNGSPSHKHEIREVFHRQLKRLWSEEPLVGQRDHLLKPRDPAKNDYCLLREMVPFTFVPLVTAEMSIVVEITVVLLRPEPPGKLLTQGGDIDNRLKTLFDALTMPRHSNAMPTGTAPTPDQVPHFFCLLEDDNLVTALTVRTEQLLEDVPDPGLVDLTLHAWCRPTKRTWGNGAFG